MIETVVEPAPTLTAAQPNVTQAIAFFWVTNMQASLRFYVDGLGFEKTKEWTPRGSIEWCWLQLGPVAHMLQEYRLGKLPAGKLGEGVSIYFQSSDALAIYHQAIARGLTPQQPFVGNGLWVTTFSDPDGYKLHFVSPTDVPEETLYDEAAHASGSAK